MRKKILIVLLNISLEIPKSKQNRIEKEKRESEREELLLNMFTHTRNLLKAFLAYSGARTKN